MGPRPPAFHNRRVQGTQRGLEGRSWRRPPAVPSSWDSLALLCHSAGLRPWDTDREQDSLAQGRQCLAARKSDRRTVRTLGQLPTAVVVVAVEAEAAAAAAAGVPGGLARRAGAAAASPGTG